MRFSIRDVLWLTVVVGMGAGWWMDHRRQELAQAQTFDMLVQALKPQNQKPQLPRAFGFPSLVVAFLQDWGRPLGIIVVGAGVVLLVLLIAFVGWAIFRPGE